MLKIAVSLVLLILVFRKINFTEIGKVLSKIQLGYFCLAAILFIFSQILSAKRLEFYLHAQDFRLNYRSNLQLYFLGMFYNFFIPGGIGGDAYKIYLLHKKFDWKAKTLTSVLFNDRLSGLLAICALIGISGAVLFNNIYSVLCILGSVFFVILAYFLSKKLFPSFKQIFFKTLLLSFFVQLLQIFCFIFLLKSLEISDHYLIYASIFLISSVLSLISFAGIGVREMLFLQAAKLFEFNPTVSVSASLLFTLITAIFSFIGIYFQIRKLNLNLVEN